MFHEPISFKWLITVYYTKTIVDLWAAMLDKNIRKVSRKISSVFPTFLMSMKRLTVAVILNMLNGSMNSITKMSNFW